MKITQIETIRLPEHPVTLWVQIHTSEGLVGLGETYHVPAAVEAVIHDYLAPFILGQSAFDRERHWQNFFAQANFFGTAGAEMRALSAVDIALWDAVGQYAGQPMYNLIGGRSRDWVPVYNTCVNTPRYADQDAFLKSPSELAASLLAQGFRQMKIWPWDRFAPQLRPSRDPDGAGWTAVGPPGHALSAEELRAGLWVVEEIRRSAGHRIEIAIEGHGRWDLPSALRIARALEPFEVIWMEDMLQPTSAADLGRLVEETRVPQAVSERLITRSAYREVLERGAAHIIMLDPVWTGGITESVKIAAMADLYHLPVTTHDCSGPVAVFAGLHLCATAPNAMIQETVRGYCEGYYQDLVTQPVPVREGRAALDLGPGLGTRLRPELLSRTDLARVVSSVDGGIRAYPVQGRAPQRELAREVS